MLSGAQHQAAAGPNHAVAAGYVRGVAVAAALVAAVVAVLTLRGADGEAGASLGMVTPFGETA